MSSHLYSDVDNEEMIKTDEIVFASYSDVEGRGGSTRAVPLIKVGKRELG